MASRSKAENMKGFYRQRKSNSSIDGGISKKKKSQSPAHPKAAAAASFGSDVTQPTTLILHGSPDLKDSRHVEVRNEVLLKKFDMNLAYGPCIGMTRLARLERACSLGLNLPKEVESLLNTPNPTSNPPTLHRLHRPPLAPSSL